MYDGHVRCTIKMLHTGTRLYPTLQFATFWALCSVMAWVLLWSLCLLTSTWAADAMSLAYCIILSSSGVLICTGMRNTSEPSTMPQMWSVLKIYSYRDAVSCAHTPTVARLHSIAGLSVSHVKEARDAHHSAFCQSSKGSVPLNAEVLNAFEAGLLRDGATAGAAAS